MKCSLPGSSVHGVPQQEYWSRLPFPAPGDLSNPRIKPRSPTLQVVSCNAGGFLTSWATRKPCSVHTVNYFSPTKGRHARQDWSEDWILLLAYVRVCVCVCVCTQSLSCVWLFVTPWTVAHHVPLSVGFSRQEHWSGLPFPPPGDLPDPGIEPESPSSPALQVDSLPLSHWISPLLASTVGQKVLIVTFLAADVKIFWPCILPCFQLDAHILVKIWDWPAPECRAASGRV